MWRPAVALAVVWLVATTVGPTSLDAPNDLPIYRVYAEALRAGLLPYRDFGLEYPPLALAPMALGATFGLGVTAYAWTFGTVMLGAALVVQRQVARLGGPGAAWAVVALPVAAGAIVRTRFDLVPVALAIAGVAVLACGGGQARVGFALLGLGTATKLFPAVLAAVGLGWLAAAGRRREARAGAITFVLVLLAACLPFALLGPGGFLAQFTFHVQRPVQIESTPASILWLLGDSYVTGAPAHPDRFRSNGLAGGAAPLVAALMVGAQLAALVGAFALAARTPGRKGLVLGSLAALLAFVALGKVLSPQFELWLAPFALVAFALGERLPAVLVLATVPLTQLEFPARYAALVAGDSATVALVGLRNGLLLVALALLLRPLAAAPARSRPPGAARPASTG